MNLFRCGHCEIVVFFQNDQCLSCGAKLAFLPDVGVITSIRPLDGGLWAPEAPALAKRRYRLCEHDAVQGFCNWAVPVDDPNPQCVSCRLTRTIPDLDLEGHHDAWVNLESAKRRLIYSLLELRLPVADTSEDPEHGLVFEFLADPPPQAEDSAPVMTGHAGGVITINIAEADDAERERRRLQLHEPYRTLLGHFRHEIGHYYWDRLIDDSERLKPFRALFGDEREDYAEAAQRHYEQGAPADWSARFISAYATMHPWEDWAETWAHYLHMLDTIDTAANCGLQMTPAASDLPALDLVLGDTRASQLDFDALYEKWTPLTFLLNNLSRSLGQGDAYPFVLPAPAVDKLRFVHDTIRAQQA
ncbi:MAG: putative zinc-binding peptidase [Gammaproteobacteria bacterium]|nr:putative zinc-binding peptidase [Gammaproteobacteria bacterium]